MRLVLTNHDTEGGMTLKCSRATKVWSTVPICLGAGQ